MAHTTLPGFRDFYPEQFAERAYVTRAWREVARRYAFMEYDGPPLESLELYTAKSGDEIVGQLYNFVDKGGREVALRPEMTPTFARMVSARANSLRKPTRWFSIPQLFRYERQQKGRLREHYQLNVDIVGEAGVAADAELVASGLTPRAEAVRMELLTQFGRLQLGGFEPDGVSSGHMEGSAHYDGRAVDVFVRPISRANKVKGWAIAHWSVANVARLRIRTVIFDDRIWTAGRQGWRDYDPPSSSGDRKVLEHRDHVNIDVFR